MNLLDLHFVEMDCNLLGAKMKVHASKYKCIGKCLRLKWNIIQCRAQARLCLGCGFQGTFGFHLTFEVTPHSIGLNWGSYTLSFSS